MENKEFGKKLKELINFLGITQREFSAKLKMNDSAISRYIKGERMPRVDILWNISKVFGVPLNFFDEKNTKENLMPNIKEMVFRNGKDLSKEEKLELIEILSSRTKINDKKSNL